MSYQPKHMRGAARAGEGAVEPVDGAPSRQEQVGRSAALMSALVVVSRLTGFLRTWGQAFALGTTVLASCYTVANNLPNLLYELVVGGMLVTAFLPVYMTVKRKLGTKGASDYTSNLVSIILLLMGAVTLLGIAFAAQIVYTQSFSASADFDSDLATWFFRIFAVEVVLYALSSIFSGVLNAERDYFWSSAAPIFNNFVTTASFFAYAFLAPHNQALALVLLALGNPLGVLVQVLMQMPSLRRHGIRLRLHIDWHDPALRDTVRLGVPSLVMVACTYVTTSVQTSASLAVTASGASVSYYARLWYTLPYAILAVPLTTAMFTELSDSYAQGDMDGFRRGVCAGTSKIVFYLVPMAMLIYLFAEPLAAFFGLDALSVDMTVSYLRGLVLALPLYGACMYFQKVCSAMHRMGLYAAANVVGSLIQTAACLLVAQHLGLFAVALTSVLFFASIDVVMLVSLRRKLGPFGAAGILASLLRSLVVGAAGVAVGFAVISGLGRVLGPVGGSVGRALLFCVAGGIPSLVAVFGLAMALRMPEVDFVRGLLRRVVRR